VVAEPHKTRFTCHASPTIRVWTGRLSRAQRSNIQLTTFLVFLDVILYDGVRYEVTLMRSRQLYGYRTFWRISERQ
jgi:hypothetical protein